MQECLLCSSDGTVAPEVGWMAIHQTPDDLRTLPPDVVERLRKGGPEWANKGDISTDGLDLFVCGRCYDEFKSSDPAATSAATRAAATSRHEPHSLSAEDDTDLEADELAKAIQASLECTEEKTNPDNDLAEALRLSLLDVEGQPQSRPSIPRHVDGGVSGAGAAKSPRRPSIPRDVDEGQPLRRVQSQPSLRPRAARTATSRSGTTY